MRSAKGEFKEYHISDIGRCYSFISIITLFKFHISSVTFYFCHRLLLVIVKVLITGQLNFINHLFYHYVRDMNTSSSNTVDIIENQILTL